MFLAGVLATKRDNRAANRLLAATMLAFSAYLAERAYIAAGLVPVFPHFLGVSHPLPFLFGPLIYLYAVAAADRARRFERRDALHFIPFLVAAFAALPIYLKSGADKIALYHQIQNGARPLLLEVAVPLKFVSGFTYSIATVVFLRRHSDRVKESYSSLEGVNLRWLKRLTAVVAVVWLVAFVFRALESTAVIPYERGEAVIGLAIAVLVYGIGYMGLRQPEIFRYETAGQLAPVPVPEADAPRYERSGLTDREAAHLKEALAAVMDEERLWQDSNLTLADLAIRVSTTPHKVSEVLNSQLGQTFYDYVNGYRVREVQRRIATGEARQVTILSLALDAGFASKSTFNLVFKKHTNQTPSEYRQAAGL